jgi:hypothetical protein
MKHVKKINLGIVLGILIVNFTIRAQPFLTNWHMPGLQTGNTKFQTDEKAETLKQNFTGVSLSGIVWSKSMIMKADVSYLLYTLVSGFKAPKKFTGGVFELGVGGTLMKRETALLGATFDIIWRYAKNTHVNDSYIGIGPTIYYSKMIAKHYNLMPSLTLAYSNAGVFGEFGFSQSYIFGDTWGVNLDLKFWNVNKKDSEASFGASNFKIGVTKMLN